MRTGILPILLGTALLAAVGSPQPATAQGGVIAAGVTSGAVLQQMFGELNNLIDKARNDGDYLLARAGVQAKDALDAWQQSNSALLDKAFSELDEASRENFARARQLIADANANVGDHLQTIQDLTVNANQIVESIPIVGNNTYVLRFQPRVRPPQATDTVKIRISGVNLQKGNPQLKLSNGTNAARDLTGPLEAVFTVPVSELAADPLTIRSYSLKLVHTTPKSGVLGWFGMRDTVTRELPLVVLPETLATYSLAGEDKTSQRVTRPFTRDLGQFKAKNRRVYRIATPEAGWKWDLAAPLNLVQGHGEAARCEGTDLNTSSENGINTFAHCDKIQNSDYPFGAPGYVSCALSGTIWQMQDSVAALPPQTGTLSWTADRRLSLPSGAQNLKLAIKTFDRRDRLITGTDTDRFFDVRRDPQGFIVTPKVPADLLN